MAGCSGATAPAWSRLDVPGEVYSVAAAGGVVAVGSLAGAPALTVATGAGVASASVTPTSPYAGVAEFVSLVLTGSGRVTAVGHAIGGAHANPRYTVWDGTPDVLVEYPQPFETFGGQSAGGLAGLGLVGGEPVIVGTWQGTYGPGGALWREDDHAWLRVTPSDLASASGRQVGLAGVAGVDTTVVVVGDVLTIGEDIVDAATAWSAPDLSGPWLETTLDGGAAATAIACSTTCWVVGRSAAGGVVAWDLTRPDEPLALPWEPDTSEKAPRPMIALLGTGAVVGAGGRLALRCGSSWRDVRGPVSGLSALAADGSTVVIAGDEGVHTATLGC